MNKVFVSIHLFLLTLMAFQVVSILYNDLFILMSADLKTGVVRENQVKKPSKNSFADPKIRYQEIIKRNFFKVQTENFKKNPVSHPPGQSKKTSLGIDLWGTVTGDSEKSSYAVIQDRKNNLQALFQVGDKIQGAAIKQILRNKIILDLDGKKIILEVSTSPSLKNSAAGIPLKNASLLPQAALSKDPLTRDPNSSMKRIRMRPYFKNGQPLGLMVYGIRPGSGFQKMGLRNGDIVKEVNGVQTLLVQDAKTIYQDLDTNLDQRVSIIRQGLKKMLVYNAGSNSYTVEAITNE